MHVLNYELIVRTNFRCYSFIYLFPKCVAAQFTPLAYYTITAVLCSLWKKQRNVLRDAAIDVEVVNKTIQSWPTAALK